MSPNELNQDNNQFHYQRRSYSEKNKKMEQEILKLLEENDEVLTQPFQAQANISSSATNNQDIMPDETQKHKRGSRKNSSRYFRFSGVIGPQGLSWAIKSILFSIVFAPIYAYCMYWISSSLLDLFFYVLLSIIFAVTIGALGVSAKIRNIKFIYGISYFCTILFLYLVYCFWVSFWSSSFLSSSFSHGEYSALELFLDPIELVQETIWLADYRSSDVGNDLFTKIWTYILWCMEAFFFFFLTHNIVFSLLENSPFCENCNSWISHIVNCGCRAPVADPLLSRVELESNIYSSLLNLPNVNEEESNHFTEVEVRFCPECKKQYYLDLRDVRISKEKNGRNKNVQHIVHFLEIPAHIFGRLSTTSSS